MTARLVLDGWHYHGNITPAAVSILSEGDWLLATAGFILEY